jgi:hypothetical protein
MRYIVTINGHLYGHFASRPAADRAARNLKTLPAYTRRAVRVRSLGRFHSFAEAEKHDALTIDEKRALTLDRRALARTFQRTHRGH